MEGTIAEICMFAGNFAPKNWAFCQGQTINISTNTALYSLLGTNYGGNGTQNFKLPNLSGRAVVGAGKGNGLTNRNLAEMAGTETTVLTAANLPAHSHAITAVAKANLAGGVSTASAANANWGYGQITNYGSDNKLNMAADAVMISATLDNAGASTAFSNMQPYLSMNLVICTYGIFPMRS